MASTPIKSWPLPSLSDADPVVADIFEWVAYADETVFPRFADLAARDVAMAGCDNGRVCYVAETGETYKRKNGDDWVSLFPRRFYVAEHVTSISTSNTELLSFSLEETSTYYITGSIAYLSSTTSMDFLWTFDDTVIESVWMIDSTVSSVVASMTAATTLTTSTSERLEQLRFGQIVTNLATTARLHAKKTSGSADGSVFAIGTYVEVWRVNGFGGYYGYGPGDGPDPAEHGDAVADLGSLVATATA